MEHPVSTSDVVRWSVVIPVKHLDQAKSRLNLASTRAGNDQNNSHLALAFASDVMDAAIACPVVDNVFVVTGDEFVSNLAREHGANVIAEPSQPVDGLSPLNSAISYAAKELRTEPASHAVAVIAGDLPCLSPRALEQVLKEAAQYERSFVADHTGLGTTILCVRTIDETELDPRFGIESSAAHLISGATPINDWVPAAARLDVDTSEDLLLAHKLGVGIKTAMVLESLDLNTIAE